MIEMDASPHMDADEWERLVRECGGHPLHLPDIHEADLPEKNRLHLLFHEGSRPVACAIAYRIAPRLWRRTSTLLLPAPPALRPEAASARESIYGKLVELARDAKCRELVIQPHWGTCLNSLPPFSSHVTETIIEFVLDLTRDKATIDSGMHRVHRKNIRRAERDGVTICQDRSLEGLLALRAMQHVSSERSARKGGGFNVRDRAYFESVHRRVYAGGRGELLLATHEQKTVAGLAYLTGAGRAITVRSGSTPEGYALRAMYLLQETVIERARERGLLELNLGGVSEEAEGESHPQRGLYDFKKGWGGVPLRSTGIRMTVAP